jgi:HEAT repeat protein
MNHAESSHEAILARLVDPDPGTRQLALIALEDADGVAESEVLLDAVVRCIGDPDVTVRSLAVARLEELGDARGLPGLVRALDDESEEVRRAALRYEICAATGSPLGSSRRSRGPAPSPAKR